MNEKKKKKFTLHADKVNTTSNLFKSYIFEDESQRIPKLSTDIS